MDRSPTTDEAKAVAVALAAYLAATDPDGVPRPNLAALTCRELLEASGPLLTRLRPDGSFLQAKFWPLPAAEAMCRLASVLAMCGPAMATGAALRRDQYDDLFDNVAVPLTQGIQWAAGNDAPKPDPPMDDAAFAAHLRTGGRKGSPTLAKLVEMMAEGLILAVDDERLIKEVWGGNEPEPGAVRAACRRINQEAEKVGYGWRFKLVCERICRHPVEKS